MATSSSTAPSPPMAGPAPRRSNPMRSSSRWGRCGSRPDAAGGGEDVDPEQRQAISQQMVIVRTERLERSRRRAARVRHQAQGPAIEQRMVRAEFVVLMGGEVQDEIEEGPRPTTWSEGRLPTKGRRRCSPRPGRCRGPRRDYGGRHRHGARGRAGGAEVPAAGLRSPALPAAAGGRAGENRPLATAARPAGSGSIAGAGRWPRPTCRPGATRWSGRRACSRARSETRGSISSCRRPGSPPSIRPTPAPPPPLRRWSARRRPGPGSNALAEAQRVVHLAAARWLPPSVEAAPDDGISGAVADAIRRRRP